jgi:hypothetical protein
VFGIRQEAVTFFEKKVTKKTFAPAGAGAACAINKSFLRRTRRGAFVQKSAAFL